MGKHVAGDRDCATIPGERPSRIPVEISWKLVQENDQRKRTADGFRPISQTACETLLH